MHICALSIIREREIGKKKEKEKTREERKKKDRWRSKILFLCAAISKSKGESWDQSCVNWTRFCAEREDLGKFWFLIFGTCHREACLDNNCRSKNIIFCKKLCWRCVVSKNIVISQIYFDSNFVYVELDIFKNVLKHISIQSDKNLTSYDFFKCKPASLENSISSEEYKLQNYFTKIRHLLKLWNLE